MYYQCSDSTVEEHGDEKGGYDKIGVCSGGTLTSAQDPPAPPPLAPPNTRLSPPKLAPVDPGRSKVGPVEPASSSAQAPPAPPPIAQAPPAPPPLAPATPVPPPLAPVDPGKFPTAPVDPTDPVEHEFLLVPPNEFLLVLCTFRGQVNFQSKHTTSG